MYYKSLEALLAFSIAFFNSSCRAFLALIEYVKVFIAFVLFFSCLSFVLFASYTPSYTQTGCTSPSPPTGSHGTRRRRITRTGAVAVTGSRADVRRPGSCSIYTSHDGVRRLGAESGAGADPGAPGRRACLFIHSVISSFELLGQTGPKYAALGTVLVPD